MDDVVAFIGSRSHVAARRLDAYRALAQVASSLSYEIVTGAAPQCDQIAGDVAALRSARLHLVLPWKSYEAAWVEKMRRASDLVRVSVFDPGQHLAWVQSVYRYHPAPERLRDAAIMLHARNYGIIAHCKAVIALPSMAGGGTMQAIRIANALSLPVFDLRYDGAALEAERWLTAYKQEARL